MLVIIAENYRQLKDIYHSIYTLKNLIKNFNQHSNIQTKAQKLLDQIRLKKAKSQDKKIISITLPSSITYLAFSQIKP
ncbi:MAG: hypothetical protein ABI045_05355 [Flavobacteriales bacterium]